MRVCHEPPRGRRLLLNTKPGNPEQQSTHSSRLFEGERRFELKVALAG